MWLASTKSCSNAGSTLERADAVIFSLREKRMGGVATARRDKRVGLAHDEHDIARGTVKYNHSESCRGQKLCLCRARSFPSLPFFMGGRRRRRPGGAASLFSKSSPLIAHIAWCDRPTPR